MQSFKIKDKNTSLPPIIVNLDIPTYRIKNVLDLKDSLNKTKDRLEEVFKDNQKVRIWHDLDPFKKQKEVVAKLGNTENVTNAWLKAYEIVTEFQLIPKRLNGKFLHFDNAAFPGSFILACHHYAKTLCNIEQYEWKASSLITKTNEDKEPLEDKFGLWANYKQNWIMNEHNNGDVLDEKNQENFAEVLKREVDLYTSDLGFDVSSDYANQELLHSIANLGQIISGLLTLKTGGCFVTKQYTIFEPISISVIYATASFFDEFYICKPLTSRAANSEIYLVGKGFNGLATKDHPYIRGMFDIIAKHKAENSFHPLFHVKNCPADFMNYIVKTVNFELSKRQIEQIDLQLDMIDSIRNKKSTIKSYLDDIESILEKWFYDNPIDKIKPELKLKTISKN